MSAVCLQMKRIEKTASAEIGDIKAQYQVLDMQPRPAAGSPSLETAEAAVQTDLTAADMQPQQR